MRIKNIERKKWNRTHTHKKQQQLQNEHVLRRLGNGHRSNGKQ